jgi:hypothetical protein
VDLVEACLDIFPAELVNIGMAVYFNVVPPLNKVHAVEHVVEALVFYGHSEIHVKHVKEDVWHALVGLAKAKLST